MLAELRAVAVEQAADGVAIGRRGHLGEVEVQTQRQPQLLRLHRGGRGAAAADEEAGLGDRSRGEGVEDSVIAPRIDAQIVGGDHQLRHRAPCPA